MALQQGRTEKSMQTCNRTEQQPQAQKRVGRGNTADWEILHPRLSPSFLNLKALSLSPH